MKKVIFLTIAVTILASSIFAFSGFAFPGMNEDEVGNTVFQSKDTSNMADEVSIPAAEDNEVDKNNKADVNSITDVNSSKESDNESSDVKTDSGRYVGQIDSSSIEIKISGVPDEKAARAFRLSDDVKESFSDYKLESGDVIRFNYFVNEHNQNVIVKIEKMGSK